MRVTIDNYHEATKAEFKPFDKDVAEKILRAYSDWVHGGKEGNCIYVDGEEYCIVHESVFKRSKSLYFKKKGTRSLIRISNHWSESKYKYMEQMNCGSIRSCYWTNPKGVVFKTHTLRKRRKGDIMMAGKASFQSFKNIN